MSAKRGHQKKIENTALAEIITFVKRVEAGDIPPEPIQIVHHIPRPGHDPRKRHQHTYNVDTGGLLIVSYVPGAGRWTP